jgi:hypothetical protein
MGSRVWVGVVVGVVVLVPLFGIGSGFGFGVLDYAHVYVRSFVL